MKKSIVIKDVFAASVRKTFGAKASAGFTLVELLTVMVVIVVLAGLVVSGATYAQKKSAMERARAEIQAMSVALESYKIDNGDYPRTDSKGDAVTDALDAQKAPKLDDYKAASLVLYTALSGDADLNGQGGDVDKTTGEKNKVYFEFNPNMLNPKPVSGSKTTNPVAFLSDPFGNPYGYSTANSVNSGAGYNPTFDLWSTAGDANSSKNWVKNW
jgi:prepilin-type N-terminal cleavage/methylation domain-containing protein